jgi:UDP-glucose 6-dehydrogenase
MHEVRNIEFTTNTEKAMASGHVLIIAVNTPPKSEEPSVLQCNSLKQEEQFGR